MANFSISRAHIQDVPGIVAVQAECGLSEWSTSAYEAEIDRQDSIVLTARTPDNGEVLGFLTGRIIPGNSASGADAEIYNVGVRPDFRHQGIGSGLLLDFMENCRSTGVLNVWLDVRASNKTAISFYLAHGFEAVGRRPAFYNAPVEDSEMMVVRLSGSGQGQSSEDA